ncbi:Hint domain-containing protein [Epibacterium ulvae]|uniref:Hint domain-containing protein n=1 Tax=Epibacterium ulvae TaxID=1156985 RepID=UPI002490B578|nr:Hint domain-containing protein [Epibacterium ulvae]
MSNTWKAIFLGNDASKFLDVVEGDNTSENAGAFVGQTFGSSGSPLLEKVLSVSALDHSWGGGELESNNDAYNDQIQFDLGQGAGLQTTTFDAGAVYNATLTYTDGTTADITAALMQDTDGNLFLAPEKTFGGDSADTDAMAAKPIQTLTLNSLDTGFTGNIAVDRVETEFHTSDGVVDGTNNGDLIDYTYNDTQGDQITDGDDIIDGAGGDDTIYGGEGDDTIDGGTGNDSLVGGIGNQNLSGGDDSDTIVLHDNFGDDTIIGGEGGDDNDLLDLTGLTSGVSISYNDTSEGGTISDGVNTAQFSEIEKIELSDQDDFVSGTWDLGAKFTAGQSINLNVGDGNNSVIAGNGHDTIVSGAGNDSINARHGANDVSSGDGHDTIKTGGGTDTINTGDGNDYIIDTSAGDDSINLGAGDDTVETAGRGNDSIDAGTGNDSVFAGTGNDAIVGGSGSDTILGGDGGDQIDGGIDADLIYGDRHGEVGKAIYDGEHEIAHTSWRQYTWDTDGGAETHITLYAPATTDTNRISVSDTDDGGVLNIAEFQYGRDSVALPEAPVKIENTSATSSSSEFEVTYASGNVQTFHFDFNSGGPQTTIEDFFLISTGDDTIDGGAGDDTIYGGGGGDLISGDEGHDLIFGEAGDDQIYTGDGNDTVFAGDDDDTIYANLGDSIDGGDGFDVLDLTGSTSPGGSISVTYDAGDPTSGVVEYYDSDDVLEGVLNFANIENVVPCFTPGTLIKTHRGAIPVEQIKLGDYVQTSDNGFQEILWIGSRHLDNQILTNNMNFRPIHIATGALGNDQPMQVSPQHRFLINSISDDFLIRAKDLPHVLGGQARIAHGKREVIYIHLLTQQHEIIFADGVATETLYPGTQALAGFSKQQRCEILSLFPELFENRPKPGLELPSVACIMEQARPNYPSKLLKSLGIRVIA